MPTSPSPAQTTAKQARIVLGALCVVCIACTSSPLRTRLAEPQAAATSALGDVTAPIGTPVAGLLYAHVAEIQRRTCERGEWVACAYNGLSVHQFEPSQSALSRIKASCARGRTAACVALMSKVNAPRTAPNLRAALGDVALCAPEVCPVLHSLLDAKRSALYSLAEADMRDVCKRGDQLACVIVHDAAHGCDAGNLIQCAKAATPVPSAKACQRGDRRGCLLWATARVRQHYADPHMLFAELEPVAPVEAWCGARGDLAWWPEHHDEGNVLLAFCYALTQLHIEHNIHWQPVPLTHMSDHANTIACSDAALCMYQGNLHARPRGRLTPQKPRPRQAMIAYDRACRRFNHAEGCARRDALAQAHPADAIAVLGDPDGALRRALLQRIAGCAGPNAQTCVPLPSTTALGDDLSARALNDHLHDACRRGVTDACVQRTRVAQERPDVPWDTRIVRPDLAPSQHSAARERFYAARDACMSKDACDPALDALLRGLPGVDPRDHVDLLRRACRVRSRALHKVSPRYDLTRMSSARCTSFEDIACEAKLACARYAQVCQLAGAACAED